MPEELAEARASGGFNLIFARQSGVGAKTGLASMLEKTLMTCTELPGWEDIYAAGTDPLLEKHRYPDALRWNLPDNGTAALWWSKGTFVLYALGSAAQGNLRVKTRAYEEELNAFTVLVSEVIRDIRPRNVYTFRFDRGVRAPEYSMTIFKALQRAGSERFHFLGKGINLHDPDAKMQWLNETVAAAQTHQATVTNLMAGRVSLIRGGKWTTSPHNVPNGYRRDSGNCLVVDDREAAAVHAIARAVAEPGADLGDLARSLHRQGLVPRRKADMKKHGRVVDAHDKATGVGRTRRWMYRVLGDLPDIAMGKYVATWEEPGTVSGAYPGARKVVDDFGVGSFRLAYDVPDMFQEFDDEVLKRAVTFAMEWRLEKGLEPSKWAVEHEARERIRREGPKGIVDSGWAGSTGQLANLMAGGSPLRPWILPLASEVLTGTPRTGQPARRHKNRLLLCGYPVWSDGDGYENRLTSNGHSYEVLRRPLADDLTEFQSAQRAWDVRRQDWGTEEVAQCSPLQLHRAVALAAVSAIETGVPLLSKSTILLRELDARQEGMPLARARVIAEIEVELEKTLRHAQAASQFATEVASTTREGAVYPQDMKEDAHRRAIEQWERVEEIKQHLSLLRVEAHSVPHVAPKVAASDLEIMADTLALVAQTKRADRSVCGALREIIPSLRLVSADEMNATFEFTLAVVDADGDNLTLGPIQATCPHNWRVAPDGTRRSRVTAKQLLLADAPDVEALRAFTFLPISRRVETSPHSEAVKYLVTGGMTPGAANCLLTCPLPRVRSLVWSLLHAEPLDQFAGLDEGYVELVRAAYLGPLAWKQGPYSRISDLRQRAVDAVIECGGKAALADLGDLVLPDMPTNARHALRAETTRRQKAGEPPLLHAGTAKSNGLPGRPGVVVKARACQHCDPALGTFVDLIVCVPEVPSGLLCSTCLRSIDRDSPVYPEEYRDLRTTIYAGREYVHRPHGTHRG